MAKRSKIVRASREAKFPVQNHHRCSRCGRSRGFYRYFGICRICLREMAHKGELPGLKKASW
jgi:small subunit ribosomal protein S14